MEWFEILAYVIGILGIILGGTFWKKWNQTVKLLKELGEAFTKTGEALEDRDITTEEAMALLKEWKDVVAAFLLLLPVSTRKFFVK